MESILQFFDGLEHRPMVRLSFLVGGMLFLWVIEGAIPLLTMQYKKTKLRHAAVNLAFTGMHLVIHTFLAILIVMIADWTKAHNFGLTHWLGANVAVTIILACLVLDFFGGWLVHWVEHKVPLFWRVHIIHHADNNVDVTTGLRHHPLESVFRGIFFMMGIFIGGIPMYAVMIYQTFLVFFTAFTHANISLPPALDRFLSYLFVSPNMHKVHHHWKQPYTDTNYGAVFSIWDRALGTFTVLDPKNIRYGLDRYYDNQKDEDFLSLMKRPFQNRTD
jgi:sterol desaturase/sphingolipid hydroxylase (fatty acid hydroxylase superfamily)